MVLDFVPTKVSIDMNDMLNRTFFLERMCMQQFSNCTGWNPRGPMVW